MHTFSHTTILNMNKVSLKLSSEIDYRDILIFGITLVVMISLPIPFYTLIKYILYYTAVRFVYKTTYSDNFVLEAI